MQQDASGGGGSHHGGAKIGEGGRQAVLALDQARRLLVRLRQVHLQLPDVLPPLQKSMQFFICQM